MQILNNMTRDYEPQLLCMLIMLWQNYPGSNHHLRMPLQCFLQRGTPICYVFTSVSRPSYLRSSYCGNFQLCNRLLSKYTKS